MLYSLVTLVTIASGALAQNPGFGPGGGPGGPGNYGGPGGNGGWLPSCSWNDCMGAWNSQGCTSSSSGWDCLCSDSTALAQVNTCIATSCKNATDQEAVYGAIAQLCANAGKAPSATQEATFKATSGGSLLPSVTGSGGWGPGGNWNSGAWSSFASAISTAGNGPWANNGTGFPGGPWGTKASGIACSGTASWTTWTAGWGPFSSYTGLWSGCSTTTNSPQAATVTETVTSSGRTLVLTGTTFGVQVLASSSSGSGASSTTEKSGASAHSVHFDTAKVLGLSGALAGSVFSLMLAL